ncbi:hypothetical protein Pcinc_023200 [Petrolisthes cinctipes]|uniref:RING-type E3 ubiquitin transferase n=1 Tax=Petrolisthes cinctipes TaxID=88211 RepID=A0AAE1KG26_PETCI|nr:hypothetical protein Pcinc_023200 [Petrolisthes cinctipes]
MAAPSPAIRNANLSDTDEMDEDDEYDSDATIMSAEDVIIAHEGENSENIVEESDDQEADPDYNTEDYQSPVLERRIHSSQESQEQIASSDVIVRGRRRLLEEPHSGEFNSEELHQYIPRHNVNSRRARTLDTTTDSEESQASMMSLEHHNPDMSPEPTGEPPPPRPESHISQHSASSFSSPQPQSTAQLPPPHVAAFVELESFISQLPQSMTHEAHSIHQPSTSSGARETTVTSREEEVSRDSILSATVEPLNTTPKKRIPSTSTIPSTPESEDEGQTCTICFEPWGNSGSHRLASLKCGHLFGRECIEKWLKGPKGKCPQCNAKASKKDVRVLFAKSLKVLDTSERDRVLKELEKEREAKRRLEVEHAQTKLKYELKAQLVVKLQEELRMMRSAIGAGNTRLQGQGSSSSGGSGSGSNRNFKLVMHSAVDIMKDGGCRVMAYNEWLNMLVVSMPSQVAMFPGFGVKKLNVLDMKPDRYVPLHQKQIRDMAFNPVKNDLLLSVAMDKVAKITNICSNTPVASYQTDAPLWSCCWNTEEANQFFVGTAGGSVIQYDTRNTSNPIRTIKVAGSGPVVSLCYMPFSNNANFSSGGLLVARLQSCSFVEVKEERVQDHTLPLEGPFTCLSVEASTRHILVSCRPTQKFPHARHLICELQSVNISPDPAVRNSVVTANTVHTFQGGTTQKVLSRSCATVNPSQAGSMLACASDESTQSTCVWDVATTSCLQQLRCPETVIDIIPVMSNQNSYLALLTDKSVKFYKWLDIL